MPSRRRWRAAPAGRPRTRCGTACGASASTAVRASTRSHRRARADRAPDNRPPAGHRCSAQGSASPPRGGTQAASGLRGASGGDASTAVAQAALALSSLWPATRADCSERAPQRRENRVTDDAGHDRRFSQPITLRDGTPVTIRVMRPDDRERIVTAFSKLDASTIYTRFFSYRKEIPAKTLDRIAAIDFDHLAGLVATLGEGSDETVIAAATYVLTH